MVSRTIGQVDILTPDQVNQLVFGSLLSLTIFKYIDIKVSPNKAGIRYNVSLAEYWYERYTPNIEVKVIPKSAQFMVLIFSILAIKEPIR
jgi:hypothetical protein